jgi:hypothetical protein
MGLSFWVYLGVFHLVVLAVYTALPTPWKHSRPTPAEPARPAMPAAINAPPRSKETLAPAGKASPAAGRLLPVEADGAPEGTAKPTRSGPRLCFPTDRWVIRVTEGEEVVVRAYQNGPGKWSVRQSPNLFWERGSSVSGRYVDIRLVAAIPGSGYVSFRGPPDTFDREKDFELRFDIHSK